MMMMLLLIPFLMFMLARLRIRSAEVQYQTIGRVPVEVVPVKLLAAQETEALVELDGAGVGDLCLQRNLRGDISNAFPEAQKEQLTSSAFRSIMARITISTSFVARHC